jgi:hypothetical protein
MHHKQNRMHFLFYIKNIVHLMVEVPKLEFGILDLILKRVLQMDSELPQSKKTLYGETLNSFNTQNFSEDDLLFKIDRVLQILFIYLQESLGIKKPQAVPQGNRILFLKIIGQLATPPSYNKELDNRYSSDLTKSCFDKEFYDDLRV